MTLNLQIAIKHHFFLQNTVFEFLQHFLLSYL